MQPVMRCMLQSACEELIRKQQRPSHINNHECVCVCVCVRMCAHMGRVWRQQSLLGTLTAVCRPTGVLIWRGKSRQKWILIHRGTPQCMSECVRFCVRVCLCVQECVCVYACMHVSMFVLFVSAFLPVYMMYIQMKGLVTPHCSLGCCLCTRVSFCACGSVCVCTQIRVGGIDN